MRTNNKVLIICLLTLGIVTLWIDFLPFATDKEIYNFVEGSIGNIGGTGVASLLFMMIAGETRVWRMIIIGGMTAAGFILYEFLQILLPWGVFDVLDIYGTLAGLLIITVLILSLHQTKLLIRKAGSE